MLFSPFGLSKLSSRVLYVYWPINGICSNLGTLFKINMFNQKVIQKKVNARSREDILASKLEAKTRKNIVNKFHIESQTEVISESKKKPNKKVKKKAVIEKRKIENVTSSNDQYNASKKAKDDVQTTFTEREHTQKENKETSNKYKNKNTDFKKSKFKRYFHAEAIDCAVNSSINNNSEKNISFIDGNSEKYISFIDDNSEKNDNVSSVIPKSVQNKNNNHNKDEKERPVDNDIESSIVDKKIKGQSDRGYLFSLEESESSGEEEVFEPWLPFADDTHLKSEESDEKLERPSKENYSKVYNFANEVKNIDNEVKAPKKSYQQRKESIAAQREQRMIDKKSIVGKVLAVEAVSDDKLAVAILPGEKIYFNGTVLVTPLLGSINVLGYTIKVGSSQVVSSPSSQSLLGLSPLDSQQLTSLLEEELLGAGVSHNFINKLKDYQNTATILLLSRCDDPSLNFLRTLGCKYINLPFGDGEWSDVLDAELITHKNYRRYGLLEESEEWIAIIDKLLLDYKQGKCLKVLICGGQRTGKSTLFKYVINSLLNSDCSIKDVNCIDLDPGQPEFSLPTTMSCSTISQPLLKPSFSHHVPRDNMKTVVLGTTSTMYVVEEYLLCIKSLVSNIKEDSIPQVVNTMGWTNGMGLDLMLDTLRIIKPSHVIQIQNPQDTRNNFEELLSTDYVLSSQGGMIMQSCTQNDLNYDLLEVTAIDKYPVDRHPLKGNILRDYKVLSEFSHLLEDEEKYETSVDVRVPWAKMALHVCGRQVPKENILQVLNASLVALCRIDPSMIVEPPRTDLPKQILFEELITHPAECLGWAVVRGIDPLTQHLHLLTKLSEEEVLQHVNAIIMTQQYLPRELYTYFSQGEGPYVQKFKRTGAGVSTLKRRIMPRATSRQVAQFVGKQDSSHQSTPQNREFSTERKSSYKKDKPIENSDIVRGKDYYENSWT